MAFCDDSGYYVGEESDPSLCESYAPPSPEPAVDYGRSRSLSPATKYIAMTSKSDGDGSEADSEETPVPRSRRAATRQLKSAAAANGRKSTTAKRRRSVRVWSEEDEVKLLKEMVVLKKSGKEPVADLELFYQVHRFVNSDCARTQLIGKVRRLKLKYMKIKEDPINFLPTTHEERLYNLSKVVWRGSVGGEDGSSNGCVKLSAKGRKRARRAGNGGDDEVRKKLVEFCLMYNGSS